MKTCSEINAYFYNDLYWKNSKLLKHFLKMWKLIKHKYFIIIIMTKNIFSISASDINVEQLFNTVWDTCHYHWNHLNADTIKIIILIKWYEKLELWTSEDESDSSKIVRSQMIDMNEVLTDEQSISVQKENVEWEIESNTENELDFNNFNESEWE